MRRLTVIGLLIGGALLVSSAARAQSEEERKAIEAIERKAEAEKKKAIERIRKKAAERRKKEEREAKQKATAEKRKAEREKKRAETKKEGTEEKPSEPPPAEPPPAPPTSTAPPPPPAPPPPEPLPEAKPVDRAGDARWTGIGFVQKGEASPQQKREAAESNELAVPSALGALGMNRGYLLVGAGQARFNPINDGTTDDDTAFNLFDLTFRVGGEWRNLGSLFAPWLDFGYDMMIGSRKETDASGNETGYTFSVFSPQWHLRFGMDLAPIDLFSAGPFVGYRLEIYSVKFAQDSCSGCSSEGGLTHGLVYGLHARLRTRAKPGEAERFYLDGAYAWRKGKYQTSTHIELEAAVRVGSIFFVGWYQTRTGSSGQVDPTDGDIQDIGDLTAATLPIERRLGLGLSVIF